MNSISVYIYMHNNTRPKTKIIVTNNCIVYEGRENNIILKTTTIGISNHMVN